MGQEHDYNQLVALEQQRYLRFLMAMENAITNGLGTEFFGCFVSDIRSQGTLGTPMDTDTAIFHANCEWDL